MGVHGGCVRVAREACVAREMATAVDGMHSSGMHSCINNILEDISSFCGASDTSVLDFW